MVIMIALATTESISTRARSLGSYAAAPLPRRTADFTYHHRAHVHVCPAGKALRPRQKVCRTHRPLAATARNLRKLAKLIQFPEPAPA